MSLSLAWCECAGEQTKSGVKRCLELLSNKGWATGHYNLSKSGYHYCFVQMLRHVQTGEFATIEEAAAWFKESVLRATTPAVVVRLDRLAGGGEYIEYQLSLSKAAVLQLVAEQKAASNNSFKELQQHCAPDRELKEDANEANSKEPWNVHSWDCGVLYANITGLDGKIEHRADSAENAREQVRQHVLTT